METLLGAVFVLVSLAVVNSIALIVATIAMVIELRRLSEVVDKIKNLMLLTTRKRKSDDA